MKSNLPRISRTPYRAFTLIELIVSLIIVSLLMLLLFVTVGRLRDEGYTTRCLSNMRQVGMACNIWSLENKNMLPPWGDNTNSGEYSWMWQIAPYLNIERTAKRADVLCCPGDKTTWSSASPRQPRGYRYNTSDSSTGIRFNVNAQTRRSRFDIKNQATYAMLFDVAYTGPAQLKLFENNTLAWRKTPYDTQSFPPDNPGVYPRPHYNNTAINLLFYDGHAERVPYPIPDTAYCFDL